jgi:hypothetical protein
MYFGKGVAIRFAVAHVIVLILMLNLISVSIVVSKSFYNNANENDIPTSKETEPHRFIRRNSFSVVDGHRSRHAIRPKKSQGVTYDQVHSFRSSAGLHGVVFYDIFARNYELVLVGVRTLSINSVSASVGNISLPFQQNISHAFCETLIYKIEDIPESIITVSIRYRNIVKTYKLFHLLQSVYQYNLVQSTLFRRDFNLINLFTSYYISSGVEHFYLYYNGDVRDLPLEAVIHRKNITFVEWNFPYWEHKLNTEATPKHFSQYSQMATVYLKYAKLNSKYIMINDFDEYLFIKGDKKISDLLKSGADTYAFLNLWCSHERPRPGLLTQKLPRNITCANKRMPYGMRSKCIHKTASILSIDQQHVITKDYYAMEDPVIDFGEPDFLNTNVHFFSWSGKRRTPDEVLNKTFVVL